MITPLGDGVDVESIPGVISQHGPFLFTKTGIVLTRSDEYDEWAGAAEWAQDMDEALQFCIGDLIEHGEHKYGEKYSQVLRATGYAEQTAKNITRVTRAIPPERRRPDLHFSQHEAVAALPVEEQEKWLDRCEAEGLTREQLRVQIKAAKSQEAGIPVELWLLVKCYDVQDQQKLADRFRVEGRAVKMTTKEPAMVTKAVDDADV